MDLQATFLHGVAAIAIVHFNEYFFISSMNYMENVAELLVNVLTADTRCSFSDFLQMPGNEASHYAMA